MVFQEGTRAADNCGQIKKQSAQTWVALENGREHQSLPAGNIYKFAEPPKIVCLHEQRRIEPREIGHSGIENGGLLLMSFEVVKRIRKTIEFPNRRFSGFHA